MKQGEPNERPYLKGIGRHIPLQRLNASQLEHVYHTDLAEALRLSVGNPGSRYFSRKAVQVEGALCEFRNLASRTRGSEYEIGYYPGRKYVYTGLPVGFASVMDPAILGTMELIAQCRMVAMTGACCAGHPSVFIGNPHLMESRRDPTYAAMHNREHGYEEGIYSMNHNPYAILLLHEGQAAAYLVKSLKSVNSHAELKGKGVISIKCSCEASAYKFEKLPLIKVEIQGLPSLRLECSPLGYNEFFGLYQRALAGFWKGVLGAFGLVPDIESMPEPARFTEKDDIDWNREYGYYLGRRQNGYGVRDKASGRSMLPDYHYFMGKRKTVGPDEENE